MPIFAIILLMRLLITTCRLFGTESLNLRISHRDPLTDKKIDSDLDRYGNVLRAFVLKRRVLRSEIWPKIYIIDPVPASEQHHLAYQGLTHLRK